MLTYVPRSESSSISQTVAIVEPNTTYTLSIESFSPLPDIDEPRVEIIINAPNSVSSVQFSPLLDTSFSSEYQTSWTSSSSGSMIGEPISIEIRISQDAGTYWIYYDNIEFD